MMVWTSEAATQNGVPWLGRGVPTLMMNGISMVSYDVPVYAPLLAPGVYVGSLTYRSDQAQNSPVVVPVTVSILGKPNLWVDPESLALSLPAGGPAVQHPLTLTNAGGLPVDWRLKIEQANGTGEWISLSGPPAMGTLAPNAKKALTLVFRPPAGAPATYRATITVDSNAAADTPRVVPVELNTGAAAVITGRVTYSQTQPISGVVLMALLALSGSTVMTTTTDARGYYTLPVISGAYALGPDEASLCLLAGSASGRRAGGWTERDQFCLRCRPGSRYRRRRVCQTVGRAADTTPKAMGRIDVDLPAMGANPLKKDVFVQADSMVQLAPCPAGVVSCFPHSDAPTELAMKTVVEMFGDAPLMNPDGTKGVALHVDYGRDSPLDRRKGRSGDH